MALSKKHYELIARNFRAQTSTLSQNNYWSSEEAHGIRIALFNLADSLCGDLADDNPQFNRKRFLEACGF